ncbi:MAG: type II secretion system F family protein, partial [Aeoliella sp.]
VMYLFDINALKRFTDWMFRSKQSASALRMIALACEQRADLARALYALSVTHPASAIRKRLGNAYHEVSKGTAWPDSLVASQLLNANEQGLVETAEQVGNLPWALRQIAHRRESRLALRLTTATNFFYPLVILALGALVGFIVIALFAPLVMLIEGLS